MLEIPGGDQLFQVWRITNLRLIQDIAKPISKAMKVGDTLHREVFKVRENGIDTLRSTDIGETTSKTS